MSHNFIHATQRIFLLLCTAALISACAPRVAIEAPKEPITINLNVKIEHEILIKVDKQIDDLFSENGDLF
ncbi:MAG: YnbE family lipoprotein [Pseudomonadales bacterium]